MANASIDNNIVCKDCDWPLVFCLCNDGMAKWHESDYWVYCANQSCKNHYGDEFDQQRDDPEFFKRL